VFDAYRHQAAALGVQVQPGSAETRKFWWEHEPPLRVPEGADLVAHPSTDAPCGGSSAVLRTEREAASVLDELMPSDAGVVQRDEFRDGDTANIDVRWDRAYHARSTTAADGPTYLLVSHCLLR
jgi:hypothetical protein